MKALVQRVSRATVEIAQNEVAAIDRGLLVLLGVGKGDNEQDGEWLAGKIARLRVFADEAGKMNRSLQDIRGEVLVVSQFTLFGDVRRGNRPGFDGAADPETANRLYELFCDRLGKYGIAVRQGVFAADMQVSLINDGPVTLMLETPAREKPDA